MELQLTWGRLIRFWWAAAWRSVIFANLFGGALAGIMGITLSLLGHKNLEGDLANLFFVCDDLLACGGRIAFYFQSNEDAVHVAA